MCMCARVLLRFNQHNSELLQNLCYIYSNHCDFATSPSADCETDSQSIWCCLPWWHSQGQCFADGHTLLLSTGHPANGCITNECILHLAQFKHCLEHLDCTSLRVGARHSLWPISGYPHLCCELQHQPSRWFSSIFSNVLHPDPRFPSTTAEKELSMRY